ncbi:MAG: NADH-quinone oxidoreductase subunit L [Deltaproteobacteria bacterium]|nr:NADH-quinone oxidoreductase subunit L [Deltaproteobacteria bacterium]
MIELAWLIPMLPFTGAVINGFFGSRMPKKTVGLIACLVMAGAFIISSSLFIKILSLPVDQRSIEVTYFTWIASGAFHLDIGFLIDPLSTLMIMVVTGVGLLIHIYSVGYMHEDKGFWRYFAYLNLFVFFMLMLVLGGNYLVMFLGWEGVGLCSFLLIGFWYEKKSASDAGKKAFVVNRIGDFGFVLGLFLLFWTLSSHGVTSLDYKTVFASLHHIDTATITVITLLLFVGATGKSAQLPLYVWLPDAMEGPTPVSALIHAATMVTAGVYMIARNNALYAMAPISGEVVAVVGICTALFAATIGLVQNDIKKVLAYSTVSQLGYMFAAVGLGAYTAGVFHLMTHAFFKGLMFLGSGSVIHAMGGEQDMRKMGGLHKHMKITSVTFIIGALAIAGMPPFSGFWSKDEILWEAFEKGHTIIWAMGLLTAFLTAFYMFRQVFMTFTGECRADRHTQEHLHESPKIMTVPLIILAILAAAGGIVGISFFEEGTAAHHFLSPVFEQGGHAAANVGGHVAQNGEALHGGMEAILMAVSVAAGLCGIFLAGLLYYAPLKKYAPSFWRPEVIAAAFKPVYALLYNKYYVDEMYDHIIVNPIKRFCGWCLSFDLGIIDGIVNGAAWTTRLWAWLLHKFDIYIIDGVINSAATFTGYNSGFWRRLQTGRLQNYALIFVIGLLIIVGSALLG